MLFATFPATQNFNLQNRAKPSRGICCIGKLNLALPFAQKFLCTTSPLWPNFYVGCYMTYLSLFILFCIYLCMRFLIDDCWWLTRFPVKVRHECVTHNLWALPRVWAWITFYCRDIIWLWHENICTSLPKCIKSLLLNYLSNSLTLNPNPTPQLLLEEGADVDATNRSGNTAAHIACLNGHDEGSGNWIAWLGWDSFQLCKLG